MTIDPKSVVRPVLVCAFVSGAATAFAFAGGVFGRRVTPTHIVDALESRDGTYPAARRAHAKGACFSGHFDSNGESGTLTRARALAPGARSRVVGRFSTGGGKPHARDGRLVFRGMALRLAADNGEEWRIAMDHTPIFPVKRPEDFVALQVAMRPGPGGKPDANALQAFLRQHPETQAFNDYLEQAPIPSSFANGTYYGINAFYFVDRAGTRQPVRWSLVPEAPFEAISRDQLTQQPPDFLFGDVWERIAQAPLRWRLEITLAEPGDPLSDATVRWPAGRKTVTAGELVVDRVGPESAQDCRDLNFDPLVLPPGIQPSSDPLLAARSAAYAASFRRRAEGS
jgi:catalase